MDDLRPAAPATEVVEREVHIAASPDVVWSHWVDPTRLVRWMGREATIQPWPGGTFRVDYGNGQVVRGEYRELDAPRRLVLTWGWEAEDELVRPGASRVEVELEPSGDGTRLRLRHLLLPAGERASHGQGWDYFLSRLAEAAPG